MLNAVYKNDKKESIIVQYYFWGKCIFVCVCVQLYFLTDHHCNTKSELTKMLKKGPNLHVPVDALES